MRLEAADMNQFKRIWPKTREEAYDANDAWEAWAQAHDPPFHLRDVLRDLITAAKEKDTLTYGYFRRKYGLARGSSLSRTESVGSGVGWVVGVVARIFALAHGTNINLSSLVVDKATKVDEDPGYPGVGFAYHHRNPTYQKEEARRAQKEVWTYFSRISGAKFSELRKGTVPSQDREDDAMARELLNQLRRHKGAPDVWGRARLRIGQDKFRRVVLANFDHRCAVCGLNVDALLEAAHLRPWSHRSEERLDPANGVALCSLHHTAQERALLEITSRGRIRVAPEARRNRNPIVQGFLAKYHGNSVYRPKWAVRYV